MSEARHAIRLVSPFTQLIDWFHGEPGNARSRPDLNFVVPGQAEPLLLHQSVLCTASNLISCATQCSHDRIYEWPYPIISEADCVALVRALRFCYGENQRLEPREVCPFAAALMRLRTTDNGASYTQLIRDACELASHDAAAGAAMLRFSAEYEWDDKPPCFITELAHALQTAHSMASDCLFRRPPKVPDEAQASDPSSRISDLAVRTSFASTSSVRPSTSSVIPSTSSAEPSTDEDRSLLELDSLNAQQLTLDEIKTLRETRMSNIAEVLELSMAALENTARQAEGQRRQLEDWEHVVRVGESISVQTEIDAGVPDAACGGSVLDDSRSLIVSTCLGANRGRDLLVTILDDATHGHTEKYAVLPFSTMHHAPVSDGASHVYFMESAAEDSSGRGFMRVDMDTWRFEKLPDLPGSRFSLMGSGCWHIDSVYVPDEEGCLWRFQASNKTWRRVGGAALPSAEGVRLLSNPYDAHCLYAMTPSGALHRIDLDTLASELVTQAPGPSFYSRRSALLLAASERTFVVIAALDEGNWSVYSSVARSWSAATSWEPTPRLTDHSGLVYSRANHLLYYHVHGEHTWTAVPLLPHER